MNEMTLPFRHRIRNSGPGGLRPNTLPLGHGGSPQYSISRVSGEETFYFFETRVVFEPAIFDQAGSFNQCTRAPAHMIIMRVPSS